MYDCTACVQHYNRLYVHTFIFLKQKHHVCHVIVMFVYTGTEQWDYLCTCIDFINKIVFYVMCISILILQVYLDITGKLCCSIS